MIATTHFLVVSAFLFCIGMYAVLAKKNAIMVLIGIELMVNAAVINLVAFSKFDKINMEGQITALFAIVIADSTVAITLSLILRVYRYHKNIDPNKITELKEK